MNFNPIFYKNDVEIHSNLTNTFCFYDDSSVEIYNSSYSKKISGDTNFAVPVEILVYEFFFSSL